MTTVKGDPVLLSEPIRQAIAELKFQNPELVTLIQSLVQQEVQRMTAAGGLKTWGSARDVAEILSVTVDHVRRLRDRFGWVEGAEFIKSDGARPTYRYRLALIRHWESIQYLPHAQMLQEAARKKLMDEDRKKLRSAKQMLKRSPQSVA